MPIRSLKLRDDKKIDSIVNRQSIFLDSNLWIDLAEGKYKEAQEARSLLIKLVCSESVFCPLSVTNVLELFLQEYDSALRQAQLMETLSLSITFKPREEIEAKEINRFVFGLLEKRIDVPIVVLGPEDLFGPVISYLGSNMRLEFPAEAPVSFIDDVMPKLATAATSLGLVQLVEMMKRHLPMKDWKEDFDSKLYSDVWRERAKSSQKVRKRAREIEKQSIMRDVTKKIILLSSQLSSSDMHQVLKTIEAFLSSCGKDAGEVLLQKLPASQRYVEVLTETGLDSNLNPKPNHFIDIENMVVPPLYADIFTARDGWVQEIMGREKIAIRNHADCVFSMSGLLSRLQMISRA